MTALRVLHIDDEPDIREVVAISLSLDPEFAVRGCGSGEDGLAAAAECPPDLILLDVMMPVMDGPTTLAHLRDNPKTADIPVVFMTARAQTRELDHFKSLGAVGVIAKPFDPMTLAASVLGHMRLTEDHLARARGAFVRRVSDDAMRNVRVSRRPRERSDFNRRAGSHQRDRSRPGRCRRHFRLSRNQQHGDGTRRGCRDET